MSALFWPFLAVSVSLCPLLQRSENAPIVGQRRGPEASRHWRSSADCISNTGVTAHPNAQWIARQLTEAYGWQQTPGYVIRDRIAAATNPLATNPHQQSYCC